MSVVRSFPALARRIAQIAREGRATLIDNVLATLNGLTERIAGVGAVGAARRVWRYHDHGPEGGIPLPRGSIFSFDTGERASFEDDFSYTINATATQESLAAEYGMEFLFPAEVSFGIDSDSTNLSSNPCALRAELTVRVSSADDVEITIKNLTTGTSSSAATTDGTTGIQTLTISDVPCKGGQTNLFDILVECSTATPSVFFHGLNLIETRNESQPQSSGTTTYSSL